MINLENLKKINFNKMKKEALLVTALALFIFVILYYKVFLQSALSELFSVMPEVKSLRQDIAKAREDINYEAILKNKLTDTEAQIRDYEKKLPAEQEITLLLADLSGMAKDSYVKILGITPMNAAPKDRSGAQKGYREIPIMISAQSGYHEFGAFINKLENAGRFMEVSDLSIVSNRDDPKRHTIDLIVSTYALTK